MKSFVCRWMVSSLTFSRCPVGKYKSDTKTFQKCEYFVSRFTVGSLTESCCSIKICSLLIKCEPKISNVHFFFYSIAPTQLQLQWWRLVLKSPFILVTWGHLKGTLWWQWLFKKGAIFFFFSWMSKRFTLKHSKTKLLLFRVFFPPTQVEAVAHPPMYTD